MCQQSTQWLNPNTPKCTRIPLKELNKFIEETHDDNLDRIRTILGIEGWHWMLPESWVNNKDNRCVLFNSINAYLLHKG